MITRKRPTKPLIDATLDELPPPPNAGEFDPACYAAIKESFLRLQARLSAPKRSGADGQKNARARNLLSLNATPTSSQILYHYCGGDAFWSIIEKGDIWLSDIFSLNDSTELKWGRDTFLKVFLEHPHLFDDDFRDFAIYMVFSMHEGMRPFVGSFSANGDLLSQWRAYSDDGRGFSLGLRASHIHKKWGVRLKKIEYRERRQETIIKQSLLELQDIWRKTGGVIAASNVYPNPNVFPDLKYPTPQFREVRLSYWVIWSHLLSEFAMDLSSLKHPTFFEEKEYRIIRAIGYSEGKFSDAGAGSRGGPVPVKERMRGSDKIAYIEFSFDQNRDSNIVRTVVLGPKNPEDTDIVRTRIVQAGFQNCIVKRSSTTYR